MLPRHSLESTNLSISIPWDSNTFRGFVGAVCLTTVVLLLLPYLIDVTPRPTAELRRSIPVELIDLSFGDGDGTGARKGNLRDEGKAVKGNKVQNPLEDAQIAATMKTVTKNNPTEYVPGANVKPANIASNTPSKDSARASGSRSIGTENGSPDGTGLGDFGGGSGKGRGWGDIEWGGGGNRVVMSKVIPRLPPGSNTSAVIKLRFTVRPDGTVASVLPMQKGEPTYEQAAMAALRKWRFNPLTIDRDMVGTISFYFKIQ